MKDAHDPREFRHWEKRTADGTVLAVVELDASIVPTSPDAQGHVYVLVKE